jgi:hypothetical protein
VRRDFRQQLPVAQKQPLIRKRNIDDAAFGDAHAAPPGMAPVAAVFLATVAAAEVIVSVMDLLLMGTITADYLLTGLVAAGLVAPASLYLMSAVARGTGAAKAGGPGE